MRTGAETSRWGAGGMRSDLDVKVKIDDKYVDPVTLG